MLRTTREVKSFTGIGWGLKPEVKLAGGPVYQDIILTTNLLASQFSIEFWYNGDPIIQMTGEQLVMLEQYKKRWVQEGKFRIPLGDLAGRSIEGQMVSGLETMPSDNIMLKVLVGAEPSPNNQGNVTLMAEANVNAPLANQLGAALEIWHPRITVVTFDAGATGKNILDTIAIGPRIKRAHFLGDISHLRLLKGNGNTQNVVWERSAGTNEFLLKGHDKAPQAGYFHFDPCESGFILAEALDTADAQIIKFEATVTTPGYIPVLMETLERVA